MGRIILTLTVNQVTTCNVDSGCCAGVVAGLLSAVMSNNKRYYGGKAMSLGAVGTMSSNCKTNGQQKAKDLVSPIAFRREIRVHVEYHSGYKSVLYLRTPNSQAVCTVLYVVQILLGRTY